MSKKKSQQENFVPAPQAAAAENAAAPASPGEERGKWFWLPLVLMAVFFLATCFTTSSTIKSLAFPLLILTIGSCLVRFPALRDRITLPAAAVGLWVAMNGVSIFYAASSKFALSEFLRILVGFCCFLLILAWSRKGEGRGRAAAAVLEGGTALASLISIDMLSTHWLSVPLFRFLGKFSFDFFSISAYPIEAGVRMNSLYENPNVFAGIAGLAVLLGLGLAVTAQKPGERRFHLVCLFINSLAFLLVFSMGASGMIALAFLVFLLVERKERKASLLVLMVETLVLALAGAFPIYLTSFSAWSGFQPIPLACALGGAALLCLADQFPGQRAAGALGQKGGKLLGGVIALVLVLLAGFGAAAMNLTGAAGLTAGESLRRAEYPDAGTYTLQIQATGALQVTIESQNQQETMMHTSTVLYSGDAQGAEFTVPEGSLVTYFNFRAEEDLTFSEAAFSGSSGSGSLKLHYSLLPGFIANRLQGLFANENAIQRTVFFADGMKLFRQSPLFGRGLGSFEVLLRSVQSFYYTTKYTHNHYVESLLSTGAVGLVLFLLMLGTAAAALWKNLRREEGDPLAPALAAALVFMMGHAGVEVVFSFSFYLPMALGVLGLISLCCGGELPLLGENDEARSWVTVVPIALLTVFTVLLYLNMHAQSTVEHSSYDNRFNALSTAAKMDCFESSDYLLSYVWLSLDIDKESQWTVYQTANSYAQKLSKLESNTIFPYLAQYYFFNDQPEEAISMLEKHVAILASDSGAWQTAFDILEANTEKAAPYKDRVLALYDSFQTWNRENMGTIELSQANLTWLEGIQ